MREQIVWDGLMEVKERRGRSVLPSRKRMWRVVRGEKTPSHEGGCPYREDVWGKEEAPFCDITEGRMLYKGKREMPRDGM